MIWAILVAVGFALWLCAWGIMLLVLRNRALRIRPGALAVRVRRPGQRRWVRGHGVWVHDVFAFRGSPAAWKEELIWASAVTRRPPLPGEPDRWRTLGDDPVVAVLTPVEAMEATIEVAARGDHRDLLAGPFMALDVGFATRRP